VLLQYYKVVGYGKKYVESRRGVYASDVVALYKTIEDTESNADVGRG
jgi:hypothetical protein